MPAIILPSVWRQQPRGIVVPNYGGLFGSGLECVIVPGATSQSNGGFTLGANGSIVPTEKGLSLRGDGSSNIASLTKPIFATSTEATVTAVIKIDSFSSLNMIWELTADGQVVNGGIQFYQESGINAMIVGTKGSTSATLGLGAPRPATGVWHVISTRHRIGGATGDNCVSLMTDGVVQTFTGNTGATTGGNLASDNFYILSRSSSSLPTTGNIALLAVHSRWIGNEELREIHANPWRLVKKPGSVYFFPSAAGGAYTLTAGSGSFSLTGTAATLKVGRVLSCGSGSFALSGTAATLKSGKVLAAASGSYALTGTAATLKAGRLLSAASGTYAVSGTAADLRKSAILAATSGSFALTGTAATLTYTPAGSYSLSADSGSYTLNGTTVALKVGRILPAASGSYAFTGTNVTLSRGRTMAAASGSFTLTGTNISVARSYVLTASSGSFALSGSDVSLTYSGAPVVVPPTTGGGGGPMIIKERGLRDELARIRKEREEAALRRQIQREDEEIVLIMAALAA